MLMLPRNVESRVQKHVQRVDCFRLQPFIASQRHRDAKRGNGETEAAKNSEVIAKDGTWERCAREEPGIRLGYLPSGAQVRGDTIGKCREADDQQRRSYGVRE